MTSPSGNSGSTAARTTTPTNRRSTWSSTSAGWSSFRRDTLPGFTESLLALLPGSARSPVLAGPGRRLRRAAQRGHLGRACRRARRAGAGADGRPRDHPWQNQVHRRGRRLQRHLRLPRRDRRHPGRPAGRPAGQPPGAAAAGARPAGRVRLRRRARRIPADLPAVGLRPVHPGHPGGGHRPRHPLAAAEFRLAGAARARGQPAPDPGHHDVADLLAGGRHRLRQGTDQPAAGRRRPAGADLRGGAPRRRRGADGPPDRLPGGAQAAGRQPRSRRRDQPELRGGGPRRLRGGLRPVPPRLCAGRIVHHRQGLPGAGGRRPHDRDRRAGARARHRGRGARRSPSWSSSDQRRPAARRRAREGAHPDRGHRGRRRTGPRAGLRDDRRAARAARWSNSR